MPNNTLGSTALYMMHLMSCALRSERAMPLPEGCSWERLLALAQSNSVAATCAFAVGDAAGEDAARWQAEADRNLFRMINFQVEREAIFSDMREAGLSWLPLKGLVIAPLYPHPEMRWMCDNDILFGFVEPADDGGCVARDEQRAALEIRHIMESRGFKPDHFGQGNHDAYHKLPFFNFEMHRGLANGSLAWWRYYERPWSRARRVSPNDNAYEFSREDAYLFHIAHMFKHFSAAGCGVRGLADEWVLLSAWGESLNWEYIEAELSKLGMADFENGIRRIAKRVIGDDACGALLRGEDGFLNDDDCAFVAYMLGSGTYGTLQNAVENKIQENEQAGAGNARARYLMQRAFPPAAQLAQGYPVLKKHAWLLPAVYAYRLTIKPFLRRDRLSGELRAVAKHHTKDER